MNFSNCNIDTNLMQSIDAAGYSVCTPVQERVIQTGLDGSDLYVQSQTGTGKTAAYLITVMQRMLSTGTDRKPALILVPTRELAVQVEEEARKLAENTGITAESFYGGVGYQKQEAALQQGVDLIIGTPGRVIDLEKSGTMKLNTIGFLVIDEADRMFDMGFYPDLRSLLAVLPKAEERQTMLFSATLNTWVKNLAWEYTVHAKEITIEAETVTVHEIDQHLFHVGAEQKMQLLIGLLRKVQPENTIIFCNTKKTTEIVAKRLAMNGFTADFLIGDLPQSKRLKIITDFKDAKIACLVATDVAARGLDVNDLTLVINYDLPNEPENYVHRIGRTARAGKTGTAYSLCSEQDVYSLPAIEKYIEAKIPAIIPAEEDFSEDCSSGRYVHLDRYHGVPEKRDSRHRSGNHAAPRIDKPARRTKTGKKSAASSRRVSDTAAPSRQKQSENLAALTFEQRMLYYKEQYGKHLATDSAAVPAAGSVAKTAPEPSRRKKKTRPDTQSAKQKNAVQEKKRRIEKEKSTGKKHGKHTQKTYTAGKNTEVKQTCSEEHSAAVQKKKTVLDTLKQFFFGKK